MAAVSFYLPYEKLQQFKNNRDIFGSSGWCRLLFRLQTSVWILSSNFIQILLYLFLFCTISNMIFLFQSLFRVKVPWRSEHLPTLTITYDGPAVNPKTRQRSSSVTYQLVLIGCDSGEDGLHKHEGAELLRLEVEQRGCVVLLLDDVDPWLVLVHGVQDYLKNHNP